jgi:crotonobetainyl-CoA:carnitine CoA-transferase CaiB-like acyl-CoA transferase
MEKLKELFRKMNESGIPMPMIRVDGKPSITATFAFISFNTALFGQIGKVANFLGDVDLSSANYLFFGCLAAYLGRRMTGDGKKIEISDKENNVK